MSAGQNLSLRIPLQWFLGSLVVGTGVLASILTYANGGLAGTLVLVSLLIAAVVAVIVFLVVAALEFRYSRREASPPHAMARTEVAWRGAAPGLRLEEVSSRILIPRRPRTTFEVLALAFDGFLMVLVLAWFFGEDFPWVGDEPARLLAAVGTAATVFAIWIFRRLRAAADPDVQIIFDERAIFWPEESRLRRFPREEIERIYWVDRGRSPQVVLCASGMAVPMPERCVLNKRQAIELVDDLLSRVGAVTPEQPVERENEDAQGVSTRFSNAIEAPYPTSSLLFWCLLPLIATALARKFFSVAVLI